MIKFVAALLFLTLSHAMSCTWKWEITLYSSGKTWKEEIIASSRQDAERVAMARKPLTKINGRNPVAVSP